MDEKFLEVANELQEIAQEAAINHSRQKSFPDKLLEPHQYRQVECEDCGNELLEFRMKRGMIRCVECQQIFERNEKRYGR